MRARSLVLSALFCALTAVGAQVCLPLPYGKITLQLFFVLLCAYLLPPRAALLSIVSYLTLGLCGAPVFAGFTGGLSIAASPTFGFLIGMVAAAPLVSQLYLRLKPRKGAALLSGLAGLALIYLLGGLYAALLMPGAWSALLVYLPADALKLTAASALAKPLQNRLNALHK